MNRPLLAAIAASVCWTSDVAAQEAGPTAAATPRELSPEMRALLERFLAQAEMTPPALRPTGEPAQIASGDVALDAPVLTLPVRHAHSGELKQAVQPRGWFRSSKPLPAGTPVFGLPMSSLRTSEQLIWCAPRVGAVPGGNAGETVCFPKDNNAAPLIGGGRAPFRWVGASGWGLLPTNLRYDPAGSGNWASEVVVEEKPVDFGPMRVVYRVTKADARAVTVAVTAEGEGGSSPLGTRQLPLKGEGGARLRVHGGELSLTPSADGRQVAVATLTPLDLKPPQD